MDTAEAFRNHPSREHQYFEVPGIYFSKIKEKVVYVLPRGVQVSQTNLFKTNLFKEKFQFLYLFFISVFVRFLERDLYKILITLDSIMDNNKSKSLK